MQLEIEKKIKAAISDRVFPGCVVGLVRRDGSRLVLPAGRFTYETTSPIVKPDSIYDVASITKVIPTSSLALLLIDEGRLKLDDQLIEYVPEFNNKDRNKVLIKHLLTQTLDYNFVLSTLKDRPSDEILKSIFTSPFKSQPGTSFLYSNASSILLALVVERIFGRSLSKLAEEYFFHPLKMQRTTFNPLEEYSKDEIVPSEVQPERGLVHGEVHDEGTYALKTKMIGGAAGLFSTVPDLLNFMEMLLNGGQIKGHKYFSEEIINQIQTNQISNLRESAGLGWELNQPHYMGSHCGPNTFGKTGFTGCVIVCDIKKQIAFSILSNYTYPYRKSDKDLINRFRREIADIIFRDE